VNQADLQTLATERVLDAEALIQAKRWSFAYYVAGYAVECALKSCLLARMIHTGWVFKEKTDTKNCRTHDFNMLLEVAELRELLNQKLAESAAAGGAFRKNWGTVSDWKSDDRYVQKSESEATTLFNAITDKQDGVLPWIMNYW
jgi:HEPN domain-containing protein